MITTASKGWSGALRLTLFALATIVLLSISAIISCIFPYFLPKSACIEEYSKACRIAKTGDPTALMLSAWHKAQDEKQPVRDRTRIMYNVVDWLCRNDKTAEVKDLFAPTEKILQANKMSDELACVLTDHAGALADSEQFNEAIPVIEKSIELKERLPRVELSLIYSINAASQIYIGAGKLEQAEKSVNRLRTLVSAGALKQTPPKVVYYTAMSDLSQACILATRHDLPQSEKLFKKCIDMLDQQGGAGNNESERALYDYVKCLKRVKVPQRAEFYNSKLDAPLSLNAS